MVSGIGFALSAYDANPAVRAIDGKLFPFGALRLLWNLKKVRRFRVVLMGVLEQYRNRGYEVAFYTRAVQRGSGVGFPRVRDLQHRGDERADATLPREPASRALQNLPHVHQEARRLVECRSGFEPWDGLQAFAATKERSWGR